MINRYKKMENPNEERSDRTSNLKDQVSRIYMNTIAANEREDRLLNRKLDAIDLEHRTQFLRMKKVIRDARSFSSKKFQFLERHRFCEDDKICYTALGSGNKSERIDNVSDQHCSQFHKVGHLARSDSAEGLASLKERPQGTKLVQVEADSHDELVGRLQYTENEVSRMRKSWAKQNTPQARKRAFLPHLEKQSDTKLSFGKGATNMNGRFQHRASCHPQLLRGRQKEESFPEIGASSLPKSLERRLTLSGNTTSMLRSLKRESTALTKSLSSNF